MILTSGQIKEGINFWGIGFVRKIGIGFLKIMVSITYGLVIAYVASRFVHVLWTDIALGVGIAMVTLGGLKIMQDSTDVPLTSFTMRNNNSRTFEDWMGHNTDLDDNMSPDALVMPKEGLIGLLIQRRPLQWILAGLSLMAIGFSAYLDYFLA